jgi:hypothetical protein
MKGFFSRSPRQTIIVSKIKCEAALWNITSDKHLGSIMSREVIHLYLEHSSAL